MTSTAVAKKPLRQIQSVAELFDNEEAKHRLAQISARHMSPERMMRIAANAVRTTPKLKECDPLSFLGGIMFFGQLGLEPNTVLDHGYLLPFWSSARKCYEVQPIVGYKGFIDLAYRSGLVTYIHADVVYSDDELWSYEHGSDAHLRHKNGPQEGEKTHAYCYVKIDRGEDREGMAMAVLPWSQVIKTRNRSPGWQRAVKFNKQAESPWSTDEDAMAAKTAIRALANKGRMPMSTELRMAIEADEQQTDFRTFAMNPDTAGPVIEGESSEVEAPEDEAPAEEKPKAEAKGNGEDRAEKPKQTAKAEPKKAKEPEPEPQAAEGEAVSEDTAATPPEIQSVVDRLKDDLAEASESGEIEAVLDLFSDQVALMKEGFPAAHAEVMEAADQARERVA